MVLFNIFANFTSTKLSQRILNFSYQCRIVARSSTNYSNVQFD